MKWISDLLSVLFPRFCAGCKQALYGGESDICAKCWMLLDYIREDHFLDNKIARLYWGRIPIERATSFLRYAPDGVTHNVIMEMKYKFRPNIAMQLGRAMGFYLQKKGFFEGIDVIVPIPLHWWRYWTRGYNQSEWLARGIAGATGLPIDKNIVRRTRYNQSQTHKNAEHRKENVRGLFSARPTPYRHILILDDVLTTGATMIACAEAIAQANPQARFSILTLAKA